MKAFLDSNIFLRFFVREDEKSFAECRKVMEFAHEGRIRPYTSPIVLLECEFVLSKLYKFGKPQVADAIDSIAEMRNMTIVSAIDSTYAIKLWKDTHIKLADCLIASQVDQGISLITYDQEFNKVPNLTVVRPADIHMLTT